MSQFRSLVDRTRFGVVQGHLNKPGGPITDVLFVESDELLGEIAEVLTSPVSPASRQRLKHLFEEGRVSVGTAAVPNDNTPIDVRLIDVHSIDRNALCDVLFLP